MVSQSDFPRNAWKRLREEDSGSQIRFPLKMPPAFSCAGPVVKSIIRGFDEKKMNYQRKQIVSG